MMRVGGLVLVLLTLGSGAATAADPAERVVTRPVERSYRPSAAERYYGPQLPLRDAARQVVVERGPRVLLEDDFYGLFEPVFTSRRLPQQVRGMWVEADVPGYEPAVVETRRTTTIRRYERGTARR
ncbi:hypothetical protein JOD31_002396 [Methylopila capsulata]|uniref:Uncharacterized protein n=1 Tax=Methylopila capsulata TaxID=61654 RepID=A0A9W6IW31_9HYPH|nr:hypothetical protein [Methylopila capsulata]MBM7852154.1 hypothetical protein [Methylopila capsulata]GLK56360.1 hypothetical protein GCM10008170_23790 [Methylopila capsulata]